MVLENEKESGDLENEKESGPIEGEGSVPNTLFANSAIVDE